MFWIHVQRGSASLSTGRYREIAKRLRFLKIQQCCCHDKQVAMIWDTKFSILLFQEVLFFLAVKTNVASTKTLESCASVGR